MADTTEKGFEDILKELNEVVEKLEKGNLPLEESIALYTQGVKMLQSARGVLDKAQARLEVLLSAEDGKEPSTEELDPAEFLKEE
ncbi:MAG: exodeoxyribonuclease VII small subunit [Deltaproteobacteria bacterium]|nr:exodeoxyribonuclease VII small subunit [Deltaproteobacteria bacterium]